MTYRGVRAFCRPGSYEEFVREREGFVQPGLGDYEVDEQLFRWLEVLAVLGQTACLEQRFGSSYQRMPIWKLSPYRALPPGYLVGRLR